MRSCILGLFCFLTLSFPAAADDWGDALAAYDAGRYGEAIELLTPVAEAGKVEAQNMLAHIFAYGHGTEIDAALAFEWTRRAAELGNAEAQSKLGQHYLDGVGVEKDLGLAHHWMALAADQYEPTALYNLATMTMHGMGTEQDPVGAINLYYAATALHEQNAIYALARVYLEGKYEAADIDLGLQFLVWSAQLGNRRASALLAVVLQDMPEVEHNLVKSAIHFQIAIARGCDDLTKAAERAVDRLSFEELRDYKYNLPGSIPMIEREPHDHTPTTGHCLS